MKKLLELINFLKILQSQHEMLMEIINSEGAENLEEIRKKYESLGEYTIELKSKEELNFFIIQSSTLFIRKSAFNELLLVISHIKKNLSQKNLLNYLNDVKIIVKLNFFLKKKLNFYFFRKKSFQN